MKTILATTYALNPYKGSEDGMGWNFVRQMAKNNRVYAVTRINNREHIEKYLLEHPGPAYHNISFLYYDLPYWMRFWKKGSRGAMLYFYLWQFFLPIFVGLKGIKFDISHNVNFHNDWTPSFLWVLGKPMVWGPIGHHPKIPAGYLDPFYGKKALWKDLVTWRLKQVFWKFDPFLKLTLKNARHIWAMNSSVKEIFPKYAGKTSLMPSVASEHVTWTDRPKEGFHVLSIGRLVPLKGFDLTLKAFARFYFDLPIENRKNVMLHIIGDGPERERLWDLAHKLGVTKAVIFKKWMDRSQLTEYYARSKAFLFPSHEGAGMVVAEAMSHGLPVLCLDNYGPGEFITNECGFKAPVSNPEATVCDLAKGLNQLYGNETLFDRMSKAARKRFDDKFDWNTRSPRLDLVYNKVCQKNIGAEMDYTLINHA